MKIQRLACAILSQFGLMKGKELANGEFALTFLSYNFKRAINILGAAKLIAAIQA